MNEQKMFRLYEEENKLDLKLMTIQDLYEQGCQSAVFWDLMRNAHLSKK